MSIPKRRRVSNLKLPLRPDGIKIPAKLTPAVMPIKLRRKIFVINDRLAIGAAGAEPKIRQFLRAVITEFRDRESFEFEELSEFLQKTLATQHVTGVNDKCWFLALAHAVDRQASLTNSDRIATNFNSRHFGKVTSFGSGSPSVLYHVKRMDSKYRYSATSPEETTDDFTEFRSLRSNMMLLANLYWQELGSQEGIFEGWGGAYDAIYRNSANQFRHLEDYTIFIRLLDMDEVEKGPQLLQVFKYQRFEEMSVVFMLHGGTLNSYPRKT